jgi:hypothetical protein
MVALSQVKLLLSQADVGVRIVERDAEAADDVGASEETRVKGATIGSEGGDVSLMIKYLNV